MSLLYTTPSRFASILSVAIVVSLLVLYFCSNSVLIAPTIDHRVKNIAPTGDYGVKKISSKYRSNQDTSIETDLSNRGTRNLPSLKHGGIVFFLHIPKTGGTTVRELLKYQRGGRRSNIEYIYLTGPREYKYTVQRMKEWVVNGTRYVEKRRKRQQQSPSQQEEMIGKVVMIEFHALHRDCPTFLQLSQTLLPQWKRLAAQNNIPFFSFTILREPVSMAISFFNFYHGIEQNPKRFDLLVSPNNKNDTVSEDVFLQATIANPQCLFLVRNEDAYTKTGQDLRDSLTHEECRQVYTRLIRFMDWVGTTETIRNETLPLLQKLFRTNQSTQRLIRNLNKTANPSSSVGRASIQRESLSEQTVEQIRTLTMWDQEMYDSVKQEFRFEQWVLSSG